MTEHVRTARRGRLALVELHRPEALNALTHDMVRAIAAALADAEPDPSVATIAIVGTGDRGLCAGGDVVGLRTDVQERGGAGARAFWRDEYALNAAIARARTPVVAIQHGIVLGGGVGISAHASHRVVTESTRIGFPEVTIGFVPDVGASWLLSRAPGELGTRVALTGEHVGPADAILLGLSDAFTPDARIPDLLEALTSTDADEAIATVAAAPPAGQLATVRELVDDAFAGDDLGAILERLASAGEEGAVLAATIGRRSPTALAVTLASLRRAAQLPTLERALEQEYRVSSHVSLLPDFAEGIRAQLVDKDRSPRWQPATIDQVSNAMVESCFAPAPDGDLHLPEETA
ncbi:3-hydroxyisobutyryl-CoA hydrolase [Agrococcus sp. DT81.2]|uniref:3-hydroxyisobutyryl-CoA hydrolase n=1 Tax=Agrococcus sp. DT81.2 TaxID=3393414 RepID=UPI003CE4ACE2